MKYHYRIENIEVPETGGIAQLGSVNDKFREVEGRRIVHVLEVRKTQTGETRMKVLTEESD